MTSKVAPELFEPEICGSLETIRSVLPREKHRETSRGYYGPDMTHYIMNKCTDFLKCHFIILLMKDPI